MRARLVLLVLAVVAATVRGDGPPRVPEDGVRTTPPAPDPQLPIGSARPDQGGLFIGGDYFFGGLGGCRHEAGRLFGDGSFVKRSLGGPPRTTSDTYQWPIWESECVRYSAAVGTEAGACGEWYLGHGLAARLEFLGPRPRFCAAVEWYPLEGVRLRWGLDLLRWQCYCSWGLAF
jgi:hypothetical protein